MNPQTTEKWTSRKFWGWIFCLIVVTIMRATDKITDITYENLMTTLFLVYFAANVVKAGIDKWSGIIKNNPSITKGDKV